ncbi:MAG: ribbon-helix-helix protein, CopG family [Candidatus Omnitrophica bacterium]|nr:ribbon-helix-helix protein, CopG family [Candidatus Omnitrophota bacterium]
MAITMSKELLIRIPQPLYERVKEASDHEYKSMSAFIRELLKEKLDERLSLDDWEDIRGARQEFKKGKTVSWRTIKRD